jgi:hypothetical protein
VIVIDFVKIVPAQSKVIIVFIKLQFLLVSRMYLAANNSISEDFFKELYEPRHSKTFIMLLTAAFAPVNIMLLYSIIWFEDYGVDLKRTLINKAIASMCWCGIVIETVLLFLNFLRYLSGPLPYAVCLVKTGVTYTASISVVLFLDMSLITRYLFIFVLKNPFAFHDDFW